jgi:hypothetical protein
MRACTPVDANRPRSGNCSLFSGFASATFEDTLVETPIPPKRQLLIVQRICFCDVSSVTFEDTLVETPIRPKAQLLTRFPGLKSPCRNLAVVELPCNSLFPRFRSEICAHGLESPKREAVLQNARTTATFYDTCFNFVRLRHSNIVRPSTFLSGDDMVGDPCGGCVAGR